MRLKRHLLPCLALLAMLLQTSCGGRSEREAMLERADSLMSVSPSLALGFTDSLLAVGEGSRHWQSQLQLRRLNAKNKLDTVFTRRHVDEAKTLVEHFDRSGTPNERMLAHYLLGRTYADTHEAPMALEAYQNAADCADTTAADCNYRQLGIIYGQMANIFYRQGLYQEDLNCIDRSVRYARKANNTVGALLSYAQKMGSYNQLKKGDSALFVSKDVSSKFSDLGMNNLSAAFLTPSIVELVNQGKTTEAKRYIDIYESESGYFNDKGEIQKGREVYYHIKGCYYLATHQYDSAEYYFRKELRYGRDFNNQNCGSAGLAQYFYQTRRLDSAFKYAMYSHEMCDSFYAQRATEAVVQTKELYDYTRHQREAQHEREKAERKQQMLWGLIILIGLVIIIVTNIVRRQIEEQKRQKARYHQLLNEHVNLQSELMQLRSHQESHNLLLSEKEKQAEELQAAQAEIEELLEQRDSLSRLISSKEDEAEKQKAQIQEYQKTVMTNEEKKRQLEKTAVFNNLSEKANRGELLTDKDWRQLEKFVVEQLPEFYQLVSSRKSALTTRMFHVCILLRLNVSPMSISYMMGGKAPSITRVRSVIFKKLFDEEGTGKDLDQRLMLYN